jgi:uncharacterized protein (TIGR02145 family)
MKKIIFSLVILMSMTVVMNAQPMTMRGFTAGGATNGNNSYGVVGQSFATIQTSNKFELSEGVAQMQLDYDTVYAVINYEAGYTKNGFNLDAENTRESHEDSLYLVNGGDFNYDLLRTLYLIVCPDKVTKGSDEYNTVAVSGYCWTKENLRYPTGNEMAYTSKQYPVLDTVKYGFLYTWADATDTGKVEAAYVPGICPVKWHIPTVEEYVALNSNEATALRSVTDWINSEENTNSTRFTSYPAGEFSAELDRFQGMGTETDYWTVTKDGDSYAHSVQLNNYCGTPMMKTHVVTDGLSVRCVMVNDWESIGVRDLSRVNLNR